MQRCRFNKITKRRFKYEKTEIKASFCYYKFFPKQNIFQNENMSSFAVQLIAD